MQGQEQHPMAAPPHVLQVRRIGIDTYQEPVVYMRADCAICRSEGFAAQSRLRVATPRGSIVATLNVVQGDLVRDGEIGLSEAAWHRLAAEPGEHATVSHPEPVESFASVRAKLHGRELDAAQFYDIISDIARGRYSDVQLSAFVARDYLAGRYGGRDGDIGAGRARARRDAACRGA